MAPTALQQIHLAHDRVFLDRLQYLNCQVALEVLGENPDPSPAPPGWVPGSHPARAAYAREVLADPDGKTTTMAITIVGSTNLTSGAHGNTGYDQEAEHYVTDATDDEIRNQIHSLWNAFAGVL